MLCGKILLSFIRQCRDYRGVKIVSVLPHAGYGFSGEWGEAFELIKSNAAEVVVLSEAYSRDCYNLRNRYIVEHAFRLIYFWDGQAGETAKTVCLAKRQDLTMIDVNEIMRSFTANSHD